MPFKKKKKAREIILCPKCKKPTLVQATSISGWLDPTMYMCREPGCGYRGRFYITIDPDKIKKEAGQEGEEEEQPPEEEQQDGEGEPDA